MLDRRRWLMATGAAAMLPASAQAQTNPAYIGQWGGAIRAQGGALRLVLDLQVQPDGAPFAVLTSLDQAGAEFPSSEGRSLPDGRIELRFPAIRAQTLLGLDADGQTMSGDWIQGCGRPVVFQRGADPATLAPPPAPPLSEAHLDALREKAGAPALAAARLLRGGPMEGAVAGKRAVDAAAPATLEDQWHWGSIAKSMTATLAATAVEAGEIGWEEPLGDVLAGAFPEMPSPYRDATLLHLLSHRAGLQANLSTDVLMAYPLEEADARQSRLDYAARALAQPPAAELGAEFFYSNSGFVLAAAMLEARLGQPWEALMQQRIYGPLGLTSAGFGAPGLGGAAPDQPVGHTAAFSAVAGLSKRRTAVRPGGKGRTDNPAVLAPSGGVHMTVRDMLAYLEAHRVGAAILSPENWARLQTPPYGGDYALGWYVKERGSLWHNGSNTLWYGEVWIDPGRELSAVAVANDGFLACTSVAVGEALASATR